VRIVVACICYAAIVAAALLESDSTSGFVLFGLGTPLLLDRHLFRLLPWAHASPCKGLGLRAAYLLFGAAGFAHLRPGVPLGEAVLLGATLSLLTFLLETLSGVLARLLCRGRGFALLRACVFLALLALLAPLLALHPLRILPPRTPAAFGLAFEDVRLTTADGIRLGGWLLPCPTARGNLIFCHGWGRNRGHVAGLLPTLHNLGLNVLAFDFRGHGASAGHTSAFGQREAADLRAAAAYLRQRCPGKPLVLVGISLGAAVTLQTLPDLPEVRAVWIEGCFSRLENVVADYLRPVPKPLRGGLVHLCELIAWLDCGLWAPEVNPGEALRRVQVPICFCHGTADELVPLREGHALFDAYNGPKECFWVAGATHYNVRQSNRQEYLRRLRTFLNTHLAERPGR
jgi:alpha-beta hydrolase superfamily lysophospholipase